MLAGRTAPELGGREANIDIVGLNFYPRNQWLHRSSTLPLGHHAYRPFSEMLREAHLRYGRPLVVAETGAEGAAGQPGCTILATRSGPRSPLMFLSSGYASIPSPTIRAGTMIACVLRAFSDPRTTKATVPSISRWRTEIARQHAFCPRTTMASVRHVAARGRSVLQVAHKLLSLGPQPWRDIRRPRHTAAAVRVDKQPMAARPPVRARVGRLMIDPSEVVWPC